MAAQSISSDADHAVRGRLLGWLTHELFLAPGLKSVQLCPFFDFGSAHLMNLTFQHCATRDGLKGLRLGSFSYGDVTLSPAVSKAVASSAHEFRRAGNHEDDIDERDSPPKRQQRCEPFEHLRTPDIAIDCHPSIMSLATALWSLKRLTLNIRGLRPRAASSIIVPLLFLGQLHALDLEQGAARIMRGDIRSLGDLAALRELSLLDATADNVTDADVDELLQALPRVRTHAGAHAAHAANDAAAAAGHWEGKSAVALALAVH